MSTRKSGLHRLTARVLVLLFAANPFSIVEIQTAAAARNGVAADLRRAAPSAGLDLLSPAAVSVRPAEIAKGTPTDRGGARPRIAASFLAPRIASASSAPGDATCAESLTEHRAPLVSLAETLLWPPSHPLVDVGLGVNVTAPCEGRVTTRLAVFADEPDEDQTGDGNVPGDARLDGTTLYLRAERKGNGNGRVYLVLTTSKLPDGTSGAACATVVVPQSRSRADLASMAAQASAAQAYCDANQAPPPSFSKLTEGVLTLANVPPVVDAGPDQAVDFPGPATLHGTATDDGRPNGTLAVSWSQVSGPGTATFSSPGTAETTASFSASGTYTLRLTADDGQFAASDDAVVVVAIANEAPQVDAGPDREITLPEDTVTLEGSASDDGRPAGSTLTTTWSVLSPAGAAVTFGDLHAAETTAKLPSAGDYVLRLTATDGQFTVADDVRVTVHAQPPPILTIEDAAAPEGNEGTTAAVVRLTLSYPWPQPVTVDYLTEDGTAVAGCDYRTSFGTLTFAPGETTAEILVPIAGELVPEPDETVRLHIGNESQARLARTEATLTIQNDDAANTPPGPLSSRAPADRANGVALPPTLTWSATDPDTGDVLTHDVQLGTSFATAGQSWARTCPASPGPGPRTAPVAGFDEAGDRLLLFGGTGSSDGSLWILGNASAAGGLSQWTAIPTTGGPVGLGHAASVYDAATNRLFVVGGCTGDCSQGAGETWVLTNANGTGGPPTWSPLPGVGPGPRIDPAAAIDPVTRRLIVFGGSTVGTSLGDVWLLNLGGVPAWQALPTGGAGPARSGMTASYDPERNVLIVFGGRVGTQALSDTWVLGHANGIGGGAVWSRLAPAGTAPPARWGHVAAYDPVTARLVLYGGSTAAANPATRFVFRDVWMLTDAAGTGAPEWLRLSPNAGPTGQVQAVGAFSASANRLVVAGGTSNTSAATDEIWVLADAIGTLPLVNSDSATSFTADGLVPGALYYWRIVSHDSHSAARGSTAWRFTSNAPPVVDAGPDQAIRLPDSASLNGTASDDGLPAGSTLAVRWAVASGPGPVTFSRPDSVGTAASFPVAGTYVLSLTATDGMLTASDTLTVTVRAANEPPAVDAGADQTVVLPSGSTSAPPFLQLVRIQTGLPLPVGIDYHEPTNKIVVSVSNTNGQPNFELVGADGSLQPFSNVSGLTDEVKVAVVPDEGGGFNRGGFVAGTLFSGTGVAGQILRISPDGTIVDRPWITLPGETGLMRGSLYLDRTGLFGGDLIVVTTTGGVWRVKANGAATRLAFLNTHLEGVKTIPDDPLRYGPWAGKILIGAEDQARFYTVSPQGTVEYVELGIRPEDIEIIPANQNFFGIDGSLSTLWGIPAASFAGMVGDFLIADELGTSLWWVRWNGARFEISKVAQVQWEHITFAPAGLPTVAPVSGAATLQGTATDDGIPGGKLTTLWEKESGPGLVSFTQPTKLSTTATFSQPGQYSLRLTASDSVLSSSDLTKVTLTGNQPPVVNAGPDQSISTPGPVDLPGAVADDGLPTGKLSSFWTKLLGPGTVSFGVPSYDPAADLSTTLNPSGPWTFGYTPSGGSFTPFTIAGTTKGLPGWFRADPQSTASPGYYPYVVANKTVDMMAIPGNEFLPASALVITPGPNGQRGVVRWTAPAAGAYLVQGVFQGMSSSTSSDVAVVASGSDVLRRNIIGFLDAARFSFVRTFAAGDVIELSVGFGSNARLDADETFLTLRIAAAGPAAAQATFSLPGTYLLRLVANDGEWTEVDDTVITIAPTACIALPTAPVGWWPAEGNTNDLGGGQPASALGGVGYATGKVGQALTFDGIDDAVVADASPRLNVSSLTIEGWVKLATLSRVEPLVEYAVAGKRVGVHLWHSYWPFSPTIGFQPGTLYANLRDVNGGDHFVVSTPGLLKVGEWTHVALTYDAATGRALVYVNGVVGGFANFGQIAIQTSLPLNLGLHPANTLDGGTGRFTGSLDEMTIFGRALSVDEIRAIANAGPFGKCKTINQRPQVDAGADQEVLLPLTSAVLAGTVTDDGLPKGVALKYQWTKVSGPGTVTFSAPTSLSTTATFSTTGEYTLQLEADDSELKGSDSVNVSVHPRADLAIPSVDVTGMSVDGQTLAVSGVVSATITNLGQGPAIRPFTVVFFEDLNANGVLDASDTALGSASLSYLDAGASRAVSAPVSGHVSFAGNRVYAFADSTNVIVESDETNNYAQSCANGCAQPDLTASYVRKAESAGTLTLTARIGNGGGSIVAAGVPVSFYDRDPATVGTKIATAPIPGALASGQFVDVSVTVPAATLARPLWVVADDSGGLAGTVAESDETNNAYNSHLFLSPNPNAAPTVSAGPDQRLAYPQRTATLDGTVADDGLPLGELTTRWSVVQEPAGTAVAFADATATDTTATFSAAGTYVLRLTADDGQATGSDDLTIVVEPPNLPPVVDAGPDQSIAKPTAALHGTVTDDGLPAGSVVTVQWSELQGPGTAAFANAGAADTTVTFDREGHYVLQLRASDSAAAGSDTVSIDVAFANAAPVVNAGPDRTLTLPANSLTLTGTATDDGLPLGSTLLVQWSAVVSPGVVTFGSPAALTTTATFSDPGVYVLKLTASDGAAKGSDQVQVTVGAAAPAGNAPLVALTAPLDGAHVTSPISVMGSATGDSLASWKLEYRLEGDSTYTRFAAGTTAVTSGPLGTFDPSLLLNGIYEVRLTGTDTAGRNSRTSVQVVVRDNLKVGQFSVSFVDLDVPVSGLPIRVTRTYDSRDKAKGDFGIGWRLEMSNVRLAEKGVVGLSFESTRSSGAFPSYCLQLAQPQVVTVTLTDGTIYEFQPVVTPSCQQFAPLDATTVTYQPLPGTHASLTAAGDGDVFVVGSWPGPMELYDGTTFEIYDPDDYVLTLADGTQLSLNQTKGLQQIKDLNGNTLTVSASGITHSSGRGITFARDAQGRITQVTDPDHHSMTYGYDAAGDLVSFTDREAHTTTFTYNPDLPHRLETIRDPRGRQPIRNDYYDDGRIKSHTDAFGKTITYAHDLTGRQEVVTDRDGGVRVLEFDERGNVVRETNPEGKVVDRTFDARNNRTSETLPHDPGVTNAPKTNYFYDAQDDLRSVTDPENHTTEYTYNARKQVVLMKDPRGTYTLNAYDAKGNLLSTKTSTSSSGSPVLSEMSSTYRADGNLETRTEAVDGVACVTRYEYDGSGNLTKETDGLGHVTSSTYDASGNRLTQTTTRTTPGGVETLTTTYGYDKLGHLLKTTDPDSTFTETVYDEVGRKKETHDKLGRVTKYDYDDMGRLVLTTYPDLTTAEATYDGEGHRLTFKDRAGRVTKFQYDTLGRITKTTYPDATFTEDVYDSAGRLKEAKDARGSTTSYGYDALGRQTSVRVPLGGGAFTETLFTYDASGNQKTVRDANLHTVTYEYNEHNQQTKIIFPDSTYTETTYDALGRRRAERDQAGKLTKFDYDCLGRLTTVTQNNEGVDLVTSHEYDEVGNRVLQRDANGHEIRFEYDKLGRETARTLPDGKTETKTYWPTGSLKTRTDFLGRTTSYDYDENERLKTRTYPAGTLPTVSFAYTPTGRRKAVMVAGETTQYEYDLRDRLKRLSYPDGRTLGYDYDGNGNRTTLKATVGGQTLTASFLYDPANRLDLVTDPVGRTYDHGYDPAGNRTSLAYPNGVSTTYIYDDLNRLRDLSTQSSTGVRIQSYGFALGPSGNRTSITEGDGTVREYGYDDLYRLTSEKVTIGAIPQYDKIFTYDAVGNRKAQTTNGAGAAGTPLAAGSLTYTYDTRDRLQTETGTQAGQPIGITYGYDDNGNLITKSGEATYVWDVENRLIRVGIESSGSTTVVTYAYDADGNRVQTRVTPPTGPPTVTNDLVDTSGALSQVVAETDDGGHLKTYYLRGNELLAVMRPLVLSPATAVDWQTRFFHADGISSIRRLTDESGAITDGYTYTAFGERIAHTGTDPQPYAFAGEPYDPNIGFQYHRARWLELQSGRFASTDPWEGNAFEPLTLHRYTYVQGNPLNLIDPSGRVSLAEAEASTVTYGVLASLATLATVVLHQAINTADAGVAVQAALSHFTEALFEIPDVVQGAAVEAASLVRKYVVEATREKIRELNQWQLILMLPTGDQRTPKQFFPSERGSGSFVIFQRGGDAQRVFGAALAHRQIRSLFNWIIRVDYHPVPNVFPGYEYTLHYHTPPNMNLHHFLWPQRITR